MTGWLFSYLCEINRVPSQILFAPYEAYLFRSFDLSIFHFTVLYKYRNFARITDGKSSAERGASQRSEKVQSDSMMYQNQWVLSKDSIFFQQHGVIEGVRTLHDVFINNDR